MMYHHVDKISDVVWRCSCGSEFDREDDAEDHAANVNDEEHRSRNILDGNPMLPRRTERPSGATTGTARTGGRPSAPSVSGVPPRSQAANHPGTPGSGPLGAFPLPPQNVRTEYWVNGAIFPLSPGKVYVMNIGHIQLECYNGYQTMKFFCNILAETEL